MSITPLFSRPVEGQATHAFIIGVGAYPHAKPGCGVNVDLQTVPDVPSAADSARFMCDWLLENKDQLVPPLASLFMLVSDPPACPDRYIWKNPSHPVAPATSANVTQTGQAWLDAVSRQPGDVALFYCCGHGASLASEPVLFLDDLNASAINPWSYVNLAKLGRSLRQNSEIGGAYLFVDACGETIAGFQLSDTQDTRFYPPPAFGKPEANKVALLSAAPAGLLAYDGSLPNTPARIGRFTQILARAFDGASVRMVGSGDWSVTLQGLMADLKPLRQCYFPAWNDQAFEPTWILSVNEDRTLVKPTNPMIPVVVTTDPPDVIDGYRFCLSNTSVPGAEDQGSFADPLRRAWYGEVRPSDEAICYAIAYNLQSSHFKAFAPNMPRFDLPVSVK